MISLKVDDKELIRRLLERGKSSGRADDQSEEIISNRINEYNKKTAPLKLFYDKNTCIITNRTHNNNISKILVVKPMNIIEYNRL